MTGVKLNVEALYAALDQERQARELSWRSLAKEAKVSPSSLSRMAQGNRPDVDTFGALLAWLGRPAEDFFPGLPTRGERPQATMAAVSSHLRASKELSSDSAKALEEILGAAFNALKEREGGD